MLLDPRTWSLAHRIDDLLPRLSRATQGHVTAETHGSAFEIQTGVTRAVAEAIDELPLAAAGSSSETLETLGLRAAVAGTHPFAIWQEIAVSGGERYQFVYGSMRELARREPTFALHVHVGVADAETGDPGQRPDARSPAAAAGAVGQLALLAGTGLRAGLGADAALSGLPAGRGPARLRQLRDLRRDRRPADPHARRSPSRPSSGGTSGRSRRSARSRSG